jgi:hypothetical protein
VIQLLVAKTNKYYKQYLGTPDNDMLTTSWHDCAGDYVFLALIQMGCNEHDALKDYWSTFEQFYMPFCSNMMKCDQFF